MTNIRLETIVVDTPDGNAEAVRAVIVRRNRHQWAHADNGIVYLTGSFSVLSPAMLESWRLADLRASEL